jgi:hypothetical protein
LRSSSAALIASSVASIRSIMCLVRGEYRGAI